MMNGYLTKTLAALAALGAIAGYFLGWVNGEQALAMIWAGATAFGLRRAISTPQ